MNSNIDFFCRQTPKYITYLANQTHNSKKFTETYKPASDDNPIPIKGARQQPPLAS